MPLSAPSFLFPASSRPKLTITTDPTGPTGHRVVCADTLGQYRAARSRRVGQYLHLLLALVPERYAVDAQ
eukprot:638891-Rhodomonas_salina.2